MELHLPTRRLTLHERYSVARRNAGFPHGLTILVEYPFKSLVPSDDFLAKRIAELQEHFPELQSRLIGSKTRTPSLQQLGNPWTTDDILKHETFTPRPTAERDREKEMILWAAEERLNRANLDDANPFWQVAVWTASRDAAGPAYLTIGSDHVPIDGSGLRLLVFALLTKDISHLPYENFNDDVLFDKTHDLRPTWGHMLGVVWEELILPKLPHFLQHRLRMPLCWPIKVPPRPPTQCEAAMSSNELSADLTRNLAEVAKSKGSTLHATIKLAYITAVWSTLGKQTPDQVNHFGIITPTARRDSNTHHHPYCMGNYVSGVFSSFLPSHNTPFWQSTLNSVKEIRDPAVRRRALGSIGMLAYIPDPVPDPARASTKQPTGWEAFFLDKAQGTRPFQSSLEVSDLGLMQLPEGATDMMWCQAAGPFSAALTINVLSHQGGVRITTVWRDRCAIRRDEVAMVERLWKTILARLRGSDCKDTSLGGLVV